MSPSEPADRGKAHGAATLLTVLMAQRLAPLPRWAMMTLTSNIWRDVRKPCCDVFVGDAVGSVHVPTSSVYLRGIAKVCATEAVCSMEGRVKADYLQAGQGAQRAAHGWAREIMRVGAAARRDEGFQFFQQLCRDELGLEWRGPPWDDATDRDNRPARQTIRDTLCQQLVASLVLKGGIERLVLICRARAVEQAHTGVDADAVDVSSQNESRRRHCPQTPPV